MAIGDMWPRVAPLYIVGIEREELGRRPCCSVRPFVQIGRLNDDRRRSVLTTIVVVKTSYSTVVSRTSAYDRVKHTAPELNDLDINDSHRYEVSLCIQLAVRPSLPLKTIEYIQKLHRVSKKFSPLNCR